MDTYRLCDNVWTLLFKDVKITLNDPNNNDVSINKLKVVACDGKAGTSANKVRIRPNLELYSTLKMSYLKILFIILFVAI